MKRSELLSRVLISVGILLLVVVPVIARKVGAQGTIEVHARMAGAGGWTPNVLFAEVGVPLHLHLTSDDVTHGFAVGQSNQPAVDVLPGKMTDMTLTFDKPGTYTFYCTRWCGADHWRMRGTIQVAGSSQEEPQAVSAPLYTILGLNIDVAHPASVTPETRPSAERGVIFVSRLSSKYLTSDYYRSHSPAQVFTDLRADPAMSESRDSDLWDVVASIWQSNATSDSLNAGQKLYTQNCAACHGERGYGNGVFAEDVKALVNQTPAKFADPNSMLGASPALLQGKILRGGMGTGMPSWGPILTDVQTWNLISYLYTFQFEEMNK